VYKVILYVLYDTVWMFSPKKICSVLLSPSTTVKILQVYFLQVYVLLSAHITMWYKEYYKPTQVDQAVYGSINTKYRVESIEIRRQKRNKQNNNNQDLPDIRILIDLKTSSSVIESSSEWANVSLGKSGFIGSTISMSLELRSFKKVKINSYQHLVF